APLQFAVVGGNIPLIQNLLKHGADINLQDDLGRSAVSCALDSGPILKLLLEAGAKPDLKLGDGQTPLLLALQMTSRTDAAELLLTHRANVNFQSKTGRTPLLVAVLVNSKEVVQKLLDKGADPNLKSLEGFSALQIAASLGQTNIMSVLLAN